MKALVVDTSVVSYLLKNHTLALQYRPLLAHKLLCLSFMTVAELYRWPLQRGWGEARKAALMDHLRAYLILSHDDETSQAWARIQATKGRPYSHSDAWIAASAVRHELPLVTHNVQDFVGIQGLPLVSIPAA